MSSTKGILALADASLADEVLVEAIRAGRERLGDASVTLVAPAPWSYRAELRLAETVALLAAHEIDAEAWVGDPDPLLAVHDARTLVAVDLLLVGRLELAEQLLAELQLPVVLVKQADERELATAV